MLRALPRRRLGPGRRVLADDGSVAVEAAIAIPLLLLLVFGTLQVATLLKAYSSTVHAVRAGGRMASVAGPDPMADAAAIVRVAAELAGSRTEEVDALVIWHATGPADEVPAACIPAAPIGGPNGASVGVSDEGIGTPGACNVYLRPAAAGGAFALAAGEGDHPASHYFGCEGPSDPAAHHKLDCNWPGKNRRALTTPRGSAGPVVGPDFVGVHLIVRHQLTNIVFDEITIRESAIHLLEPLGYEV